MRRIPAFFGLRLSQQTTLGMYVLAALLPTVCHASKFLNYTNLEVFTCLILLPVFEVVKGAYTPLEEHAKHL